MPDPAPDVLDFFERRRSVPPRLLTMPAPSGAALHRLLSLALRVPDHGKLEPWRLIVLDRAALDLLAQPMADWLTAEGADEAAQMKAQTALQSPLIVAVVASPGDTDRIPAREQLLSAGAVCLALLTAALADGWGAAWLTGWPAEDGFARLHLGLDAQESVVGLIHIGSYEGSVPDRPRPALASKVRFA